MVNKRSERVFVIGVSGPNQTPKQMRISLEEMARLIHTAGGEVVGQVTQAMRRFDPATLVGPGKLEDIVEQLSHMDVDMVAVDCPLTPVQFRNLEKECGVRVVDRTGVILDIFALHARSRAGKLQVEAAQLAWQLPRLTGKGKELGQQVGGYIGMRGPGETKLEVDRRRIRERMTRLRRDLAELETERNAIRAKREATQIPVIALVGYTNAGKSTLLNRLTKSKALVADQLFATLDPLMRRLKLPSGRHVLITDTVGFIRNLPHELIEAFNSTFEEVARADLLLHVVDASSPDAGQQFVTVKEVLWQLKMDETPQLVVANKMDAARKRFKLWGEKAIPVSAVTGEGLHRLLRAIDDALVGDMTPMKLRIPYVASKSIPILYEHARVRKVAYRQKWVTVEVDVPDSLIAQFKPFLHN
ncbi:MAG: GTPase HflX [Deltaproteobacteria bacterium CG11_big_fil_rev_8_21_14_0_20_47_16]|nr:MAG: GTPase HflX [Deltaproteobacteria bacterium CG11_big_fil_rev_8_21_14_0_20_47_16]